MLVNSAEQEQYAMLVEEALHRTAINLPDTERMIGNILGTTLSRSGSLRLAGSMSLVHWH